MQLRMNTGWTRYALQRYAARVGASVVLVDLGPSDDTLNRHFVLSADAILVPSFPDHLSVHSLQYLLGSVLKKWFDYGTKLINAIRNFNQDRSGVIPVNEQLPLILPILVNNFEVREQIDQNKSNWRLSTESTFFIQHHSSTLRGEFTNNSEDLNMPGQLELSNLVKERFSPFTQPGSQEQMPLIPLSFRNYFSASRVASHQLRAPNEINAAPKRASRSAAAKPINYAETRPRVRNPLLSQFDHIKNHVIQQASTFLCESFYYENVGISEMLIFFMPQFSNAIQFSCQKGVSPTCWLESEQALRLVSKNHGDDNKKDRQVPPLIRRGIYFKLQITEDICRLIIWLRIFMNKRN